MAEWTKLEREGCYGELASWGSAQMKRRPVNLSLRKGGFWRVYFMLQVPLVSPGPPILSSPGSCMNRSSPCRVLPATPTITCSCKTGILSLESFSRGIYILSSTSSKPFPPFTRNWTPQRTFIMIFIGLFRAGYRGKGSRDRAFNSLLLSALHPRSSALAHLNSRDQTAQTPSDP